jgi:hypothetical protein
MSRALRYQYWFRNRFPTKPVMTSLTVIVMSLSSFAISTSIAQTLTVEQRAARSLHQATFGPTRAEIISLRDSVQANITAGNPKTTR